LIYNPWNINNLVLNKEFNLYWADTGIPSAILNYIDKNQINVQELVDKVNTGELKVDETQFKIEDLKNINTAVLFTNAGYFTIKEAEFNIYTL
jgi:hypothetical protein